jgi:hypothetical protein
VKKEEGSRGEGREEKRRRAKEIRISIISFLSVSLQCNLHFLT